MKKVFLLLYIAVLIVSAGGCRNAATIEPTAIYTQDTTLGDGAKTIEVRIIDDKEEEINITINTDCENLGDALRENNLASGTEGPYGLYIKTVNGTTADYDVNGAYWAFSKNSEMLSTGADGEKIEDNATYEIIYTK